MLNSRFIFILELFSRVLESISTGTSILVPNKDGMMMKFYFKDRDGIVKPPLNSPRCYT